MPKKTQNYASAFKGSLSPCKKSGDYWNATGGTSLFELYTSLKNKAKGGAVKKNKLKRSKSALNRVKNISNKFKKSVRKISNKFKKSVTNKSKRTFHKGGSCPLKHTSVDPYPGNPPYGLTTTPHKKGNPPGKSAPIGMKLYERSFQGPFPSRAAVNFDLETPFDNQLIVEPVPAQLGSGKKKKIIKKKKKSVLKKKKSITKKVKSVLKKKKSITKKKKSITKKIKSVLKKKKSATKKKKSITKKIKSLLKNKNCKCKKCKCKPCKCKKKTTNKKKVMRGG